MNWQMVQNVMVIIITSNLAGLLLQITVLCRFVTIATRCVLYELSLSIGSHDWHLKTVKHSLF